MLFNSFEFLLFFPIVIIGFYAMPHRFRWVWLLTGSYFFYMVHEPSLVLLLMASTIVDFFCALKMPNASDSIKKALLCISIFTNLGILFVFKYLSFFTSSTEELLKFFGLSIMDNTNAGSYNFIEVSR